MTQASVGSARPGPYTDLDSIQDALLGHFCVLANPKARSVLLLGPWTPGAITAVRHEAAASNLNAMHLADPAVDPLPGGYHDLVMAFNVLERLRPDQIEQTLARIRAAFDTALFVISTTYSDEILEGGDNAHPSVHDAGWWVAVLKRHWPHVDEEETTIPHSCVIAASGRPITRGSRGSLQADSVALADRVRSAVKGPRNYVRYLFGRSASKRALFAALKDKKVALVGNARSLQEGKWGAEIDGCDIVIRFNRAPIVSDLTHGSRTDWIATGISLNPAMLRDRRVRYVLWLGKLRKMPAWMYGRRDVFIGRRSSDTLLRRRIGKTASTGFKMIEILARSQAREVRLYGFDFFSTLSFSGHRTVDEVPHDFRKEGKLVGELIERDKRFILCR
jgi:hypothetical protein